MAKIPGTNVIAPVVPFDTADVHPSHEARYGKGGYRTVATLAERDAIPAPRREAGMLVFVTADSKTYQLGGDLSAWSEFKSGASTWEELAGKPSTFPPSSHGHTIADVAGLQTALDAKQAAGSYAASVHAHGISDVTGLQTALDAKATPADVTAAVAAVVDAAPASLDTLNELAAALGDDANFAATVTSALAAKAPLANPTFTGTVSGVTKAMVGLGNVDNTSDANKPISTATQAALDGKVNTSDSRLTDSREWSADTITQAEAEAGTATTRRAFTALRVFQAIAAWWNASAAKTKLDGIANAATANATDAQLRDRSTHTGTQAATTITGLATVATSGSAADLTGTLANARLPSTINVTEVRGGSLQSNGGIVSTAGSFFNFQFPLTGQFRVSQVGSVSGVSAVTIGEWQGSTVAVAYGGTGATTASAARTNLGLAIGTDVAAASHTHTAADIGAAAASHTHSASDIISGTLSNARLTSRARAAVNVFNWSSFR